MPLDPRSGSNADSAAPGDLALIRLLCRAAQRLAVAAQGLDPQLDKALSELRRLLRRELDQTDQLAALIDTIDSRIKHIDDERDGQGHVLQRRLHQLAEQLLALEPDRDVAGALKAFQKNLKSGNVDATILGDLTALQARALAQIKTGPARTTFWSRWFASADAQVAAEEIDLAAQSTAEPGIEREADAEPPFSRISDAVCHVLQELLQCIEPPPQVSAHHERACAQTARGLNWYELVSTLEEVSLVVQAALAHDQDEFQRFLIGLNQRLLDADQALQTSRRHQTERERDDVALNETVLSEVALMQEQVLEATELNQLKEQVTLRLESVVSAMDVHKQAELLRQSVLEQQLDQLTARMRDMETQAAAAEKRMLEQRRMAMSDALTRLPNRLAYDERLQQEYERWRRYQRPLTLAVCDIDHFKSINDNYGHLAGDKVLRVVAKALRGRLRQTDFIARFGGEEFVVLLPETTVENALHAMDSIRLAIANCPFHFRGQPVTITLSMGLAAFIPGSRPDTVFKRADAALYRAKQSGRNLCLIDTAEKES